MYRHLTDALLYKLSSINTQILHIRILANTFKQLLEFFVFLPLRKPFVHGLPRTIVFRKITPWSPGVYDPENSIQEFAVIRLRPFGFFGVLPRNDLIFSHWVSSISYRLAIFALPAIIFVVIILYTIRAISARCYSISLKQLCLETHSSAISAIFLKSVLSISYQLVVFKDD